MSASKYDTDEAGRLMREYLLPKHLNDPYIVRFIGNYIECREVNEAARLTGLSNADGRALMKRQDVYKTIQKITELAIAKFGYDAEEVVERVKELAYVDLAGLFDERGCMIENPRDLPVELRRCIKKFKFKNYFEEDLNGVPQYKGRIFDVEFWDKPKALELLGREKETFKKTSVVQHDVSKNAASFLLDSMNRAQARSVEIDVTPVPVLDAPAPTNTHGFSKPPGVA